MLSCRLGWQSYQNYLWTIRIAFNYAIPYYSWEVEFDFSDYKGTNAGASKDGVTFGDTYIGVDNIWNGNWQRWTTIGFSTEPADDNPGWKFLKVKCCGCGACRTVVVCIAVCPRPLVCGAMHA